jgi:cysteine desulfurase family protein (TIGR01976 family)
MLDVQSVRAKFPALRSAGRAEVPVYLDGPAGTQVPEGVVNAMVGYLVGCNANHGGVFASSRESDGILRAAHESVADLLNAPSPDEVVFGPNMTTLTLGLSRAFGKTLRPGEEILVTRLDHDANVTPWVLAARDAGATVRQVDIHPEDCTLDLDDLRRQLSSRTRLVALPCASNAVGTINDVRTITSWAHAAGALVFLDAVHYAPHGLIDVREWDCDFLACSAYKFFAPHVGVLWGRRKLLEQLPIYKLAFVPEILPDRWMTGTQNHEGLAGVAAAVEYLEGIAPGPWPSDRRQRLVNGMTAIRQHEAELSQRLLAGLAERPRFKVWGITEPARLSGRVPTFSITVADRTPRAVAEHLAARSVFVWDGNMCALALMERLGLGECGGVLRVGLVHYNSPEDLDRLFRALDEL